MIHLSAIMHNGDVLDEDTLIAEIAASKFNGGVLLFDQAKET